MALINFKNFPNTNTPINADNLNNNFKEILNLVYPIGRGFIDFTNTDYSNYLGFTWERELVGMTAVGLDTSQTEFNEIGKTGGEKTNTLTIDTIPSHSHQLPGDDGTGSDYTVNYISGRRRAHVTGIYSQNTGGGEPHNNLQPYKVVAYWKRVA